MTNTIPPGMKPFDLQEALRDVTKVITRNGNSVRQLAFLDKSLDLHKLIVVDSTGNLGFYYTEGCFRLGVASEYDLFLIDEKPEHDKVEINLSLHEPFIISPGKYKLVKID